MDKMKQKNNSPQTKPSENLPTKKKREPIGADIVRSMDKTEDTEPETAFAGSISGSPKEEFDLSEKIIEGNLKYASDMIYLRDVKEFIRRLKEFFNDEVIAFSNEINEFINKLAGKTLSGEKDG